MRPARLAETFPAINWFQTVGSLERQHPPWILRRKSANLIQLPKLVLGECEFDRREIVLKLPYKNPAIRVGQAPPAALSQQTLSGFCSTPMTRLIGRFDPTF